MEQTVDSKSKGSIECLHTTIPKENVSIIEDNANKPNKEATEAAETGDSKPIIESQIETVFEKLDLNDGKTASSEDSDLTAQATDVEVKAKEESATEKTKSKVEIPSLDFEIKDRSSTTKVDNIEVNELSAAKSNTIYSVDGTPSGRIIKRRDTNSNVFPVGCMGCKEDIPTTAITSPRRFLDAQQASNDHVGHIMDTPRKRPSSAKNEERNPVTGEGVQKPEARRQSSRRKDGNPLLGIGYEEPAKSVPSKSRVPPGGYSQGLW